MSVAEAVQQLQTAALKVDNTLALFAATKAELEETATIFDAVFAEVSAPAAQAAAARLRQAATDLDTPMGHAMEAKAFAEAAASQLPTVGG